MGGRESLSSGNKSKNSIVTLTFFGSINLGQWMHDTVTRPHFTDTIQKWWGCNYILYACDYFRLNLIFIKKNRIKLIFFKKTKIDSNRPFRFCFFKQKLIQTSLSQFFVWFGFFRFLFGLGSVRFFGFRLIKPKPNRLVFLKF